MKRRRKGILTVLFQIGTGIAGPKGEKFTADTSTLESVTTFFGFYEQQVAKVRRTCLFIPRTLSSKLRVSPWNEWTLSETNAGFLSILSLGLSLPRSENGKRSSTNEVNCRWQRRTQRATGPSAASRSRTRVRIFYLEFLILLYQPKTTYIIFY